MQRKIHNQTLFVAALSVYFGLLVVGAPPSILAQTANLANKSEIKKARLAKCETDESGNEVRRRLYKLGYRGEFVSDLPTAIRHAFDKDDLQGIFEVEVLLTFTGQNHPTYSIKQTEKQNFFERADFQTNDLLEAAVTLSKTLCLPLDRNPKSCVPVATKIKLDETGFYVSAIFFESTNDRAKEFAATYNNFIDEEVCRYQDNDDTDFSKLLSENTSVFTENNQVFIVTRLPRAGLDAFLKANKKAN